MPPEKITVRVEGAFDHYPQNFHVLANGMRDLGKKIVFAAFILAMGIIAAAVVVALAVTS